MIARKGASPDPLSPPPQAVGATQPNGGHYSVAAAVSFFMTVQRRGVFQVTPAGGLDLAARRSATRPERRAL